MIPLHDPLSTYDWALETPNFIVAVWMGPEISWLQCSDNNSLIDLFISNSYDSSMHTLSMAITLHYKLTTYFKLTL